ncbi:unnamed protein product, partial [Rotaria magnacalcarata]
MDSNSISNAFSIQDLTFPNGTIGYDSNLIDDDQNDCNITLVKYWKLLAGAVTALSNETGCHFLLLSYNTGAIISRRIILSDVWNSILWPHSEILVNVRLGHDVFVQLNGMNSIGEVQVQQNLSSSDSTVSIPLLTSLRGLEIVVRFNAQSNKTQTNNSWFGSIKFVIDYGTEFEFSG